MVRSANKQRDRLMARWDAVPGDRQEAYRRIYQHELRQAGATTDDAAELVVLRRLITAYQEQALVPIGSRWASVPERVRQAARRGRSPHEFDANDLHKTKNGTLARLLLLALPLIGLILFALFTARGGEDDTDTLAALVTSTITPTATPEISPTPTPLALEESDRFIEAGTGRDRDYFPVLLQIYPADDTPSRVFVVQERAINTADWRFDPNPDVASWVSGLLVKPVFGLPYTEDNAELLTLLGPGTRFALQMNTGATLDFVYADTQQVTRQQTDVFSQVEPGIVLILIGETSDDGLLTESRAIVTGTYPIDQEIERLRAGELAPVVPTGQSGEIAGLAGVQITVLDTALIVPDPLPEDLAYAMIDLDIAAGSEPLQTSALRWLLEDTSGNRYSPNPAAVTVAYTALPDRISPHSALQASLVFLVPRDLTLAQLLVSAPGEENTSFAMTFTPPPAPATTADLDMQIRSATFDTTHLQLEVRIFNPLDTTVSLVGSPPLLVLGYSTDPIGPEVVPTVNELPDEIAAGMALDTVLTFTHTGEPFARLQLLGREYALTMYEGR